MKVGTSVLYPNATVAENVTKYSEAHSLKLAKHITDYHAHIFDTDPGAGYMISTFQAQSLVWLSRVIGAKRVLEIGVYVGFSSMVFASAVGPAGKVTGLEFSAKYAALAEAAYKANGVTNAEVIVGDALETLPALEPSEPYDVIFIDAQKSGYPAYLATILAQSQPGAQNRLLRAGGLIIADNVLRRGLVADDSEANPHRESEVGQRSEYWSPDDFEKLKEFNAKMNDDARLEAFLVPLWDGVGLARLVD